MDTTQTGSNRIIKISVGPEHFDLLKLIGEGAFGKVLFVRNKLTGQFHAMKVISKRLIRKKNNVQYMKSERSILTQVKHPFIVSLWYAFQTETKLFLVMDFLAGGELFFHLRRRGLLLEIESRIYFAELILAIEFLHSIGVIHRDLKPENVLLRADGHICITDFGLAKEIGFETEGNISGEGSGRARTLCGTSEYMAPEMLTRTGYGKAVDWWALGALFYEMLTGKAPFTAKTQKELDRKILSEKLSLPPYLTAHATSLLKGILEKDPSRRLGAAKSTMFSIGGVSALKQHSFFSSPLTSTGKGSSGHQSLGSCSSSGLDWSRVLNKEYPPPISLGLDGFDRVLLDPSLPSSPALNELVLLSTASPPLDLSLPPITSTSSSSSSSSNLISLTGERIERDGEVEVEGDGEEGEGGQDPFASFGPSHSSHPSQTTTTSSSTSITAAVANLTPFSNNSTPTSSSSSSSPPTSSSFSSSTSSSSISPQENLPLLLSHFHTAFTTQSLSPSILEESFRETSSSSSSSSSSTQTSPCSSPPPESNNNLEENDEDFSGFDYVSFPLEIPEDVYLEWERQHSLAVKKHLKKKQHKEKKAKEENNNNNNGGGGGGVKGKQQQKDNNHNNNNHNNNKEIEEIIKLKFREHALCLEKIIKMNEKITEIELLLSSFLESINDLESKKDKLEKKIKSMKKKLREIDSILLTTASSSLSSSSSSSKLTSEQKEKINKREELSNELIENEKELFLMIEKETQKNILPLQYESQLLILKEEKQILLREETNLQDEMNQLKRTNEQKQQEKLEKQQQQKQQSTQKIDKKEELKIKHLTTNEENDSPILVDKLISPQIPSSSSSSSLNQSTISSSFSSSSSDPTPPVVKKYIPPHLRNSSSNNETSSPSSSSPSTSTTSSAPRWLRPNPSPTTPSPTSTTSPSASSPSLPPPSLTPPSRSINAWGTTPTTTTTTTTTTTNIVPPSTPSSSSSSSSSCSSRSIPPPPLLTIPLSTNPSSTSTITKEEEDDDEEKIKNRKQEEKQEEWEVVSPKKATKRGGNF